MTTKRGKGNISRGDTTQASRGKIPLQITRLKDGNSQALLARPTFLAYVYGVSRGGQIIRFESI